MKFFRALLALLAFILIIVACYLWWGRPGRVDMAGYVPADSLVYLEVNSLTDLVKAIEQNQTWKSAAQSVNADSKLLDPSWTWLARIGVAPVKSVVLSRAQFALAVVGMDSIPEGDTLRIRPEVALVIETGGDQPAEAERAARIGVVERILLQAAVAHAKGQVVLLADQRQVLRKIGGLVAADGCRSIAEAAEVREG